MTRRINVLLLMVIGFFNLTLSAESVTEDNNSSSICYEPVGCFSNDGPWFSLLLRPFPLPESPNDVGTNIRYYNRLNKENGTEAYRDHEIRLKNDSKFDSSREKTFFITHGFLASGNSSWMNTIKDSLLEKMDANVFLVDWGNGASTINYFQAGANTRIVGSELAQFIKYLQANYKLNPSSIHLIGHSLGAHASSYAAKNVRGIGRITGLDAAQPGFEGLTKEVRIDKSDAKFVDLIHTNIRPTVPTLGFGIISPVGHVDIYMNGGIDQPGCYTPDGVDRINSLSDIAKVPFKVLSKWISCSHGKSYEYFTASLSAKCKTWARRAGTIRSIANALTLGNLEPITAAAQKCSSNTCTVMGLDAIKYKATGVFAATTTRQYPYCDTDDSGYDKEVEKEIQSDAGNKGVVSLLRKTVDFV